MKQLFQPRLKFLGAALLCALVLSACGTPLAGESWAGISTDGRYIYVAYKENIFRVDPVPPPDSGQPTTRHIDWLAKAPGNAHMYAPPGISDDKVLYAGAYDKQVYAFPQNVAQVTPTALASGTPAAERYMGGALVKGDIVYIGLGKQGVRAYNRVNGTIVWDFENTDYGVWSTPILVDNTLYFGSLDHYLYALDSSTGKLDWKVDLGGAIAGTPLYDNGFLYVGTFADNFVAVSATEHKIVNRYTTEGWVWGGPVIKNKTLYFGDLSGWVYAIDQDSWKLDWKANDPDRASVANGIRGKLALATVKGKDIVIAGSEDKYLRAYDAKTGDVFWTSGISADDQILSDLIVLNDEVIFTTLSEKQIVAAFNLETGQKSWSVSLTDEVTRLQTVTSVPIPTTVTTPPAIGTAASAGSSSSGAAAPAATAAATSAN